MKKYTVILAIFLSSPAMAQTPAPKTYVLSAPLVEELFQRLSTAALVTMLQTEVQRQPPPVSCPEPIPPEPPALPGPNK